MDGQFAPANTMVSRETQSELSHRSSSSEDQKADPKAARKRARLQYLVFFAAGLAVLLAMHRRPASRLDRGLLSLGLGGSAQEEGSQRDEWGLLPLEKFEQTLSPKLKEGKEALALWASEFSCGDFRNPLAEGHQRAVARALSKGSKDALVGMTIVVQKMQPLNWSVADRPLPQMLRITKVVDYYRWNLLVNAEDVVTKHEYSISIPIIDRSREAIYSEEELRDHMLQAAVEEKETMLQACGNISADLAASEKGLAVPLYTAEISGFNQIHSVGDSRIYGTAGLMDKVVGDLEHLRYTASGVEKKARDYIASRLLQIVLKVERAGIGHLQLDWNSFFVRKDGSFFLGNFGSGGPFGDSISPLRGIITMYPEPNMMYHFANTSEFVPEAKTNMWGLGVLLYQLFTGKEQPYGDIDGANWAQQVEDVSEQLLLQDIRSDTLAPELKAAGVPQRWAELIQRLLEPQRANRIGAFQIVTEFPDLVKPDAEHTEE
ncbi:hypothetical protein, conserved [Eimeria brunetti]|uniref:Protein kinase domain-containing protein n=1 Tax=Eimeria brunetti TaxID=51314 RepID=U6LZ26_9EIME|nr:hypothetical protein, conserved [Eimeria brunetti]